MDISFLVDSSDAVQWQEMLNYITDLVEYFYDYVDSNIGIGVITYGNTAKVSIPLNSLSGPSFTKKDILKSIKEIQQQGGSSKGFIQAMQLVPDFVLPQQGGRVGVREVMVLPVDVVK